MVQLQAGLAIVGLAAASAEKVSAVTVRPTRPWQILQAAGVASLRVENFYTVTDSSIGASSSTDNSWN